MYPGVESENLSVIRRESSQRRWGPLLRVAAGTHHWGKNGVLGGEGDLPDLTRHNRQRHTDLPMKQHLLQHLLQPPYTQTHSRPNLVSDVSVQTMASSQAPVQ